MSFHADLGDIAFGAVGLVQVLLGAFVLSLRPRRGANLAFAAFSIASGATDVTGSWRNVLASSDALFETAKWAFAAASIAGAAVLPLLALRFPRPLPRKGLRLLALPLALGGGFLAVAVATGLPTGRFAFSSGLSGLVGIATFLVLMAETYFFCALLALRFHGEGAQGSARPMYALAGVALALGPGLQVGIWLAIAELPEFLWKSVAGAIVHGALAVLWLRNAAVALGRGSRAARDAALLMLAAPLVTMILWSRDGPSLPVVWLGELLAVLLLAYAILRHQLLGLDVKVRWTVKQSPVAAAFIGVFFVVSESASSFLATEGGLGTYLGIAAAGLLVFAIAPLQRAAEKVASAAMPGVRAPAETSRDERLGMYRRLLRVAYADGAVDRREREMLRAARDDLGLSLEDADRAEREATEGPT